MQAEAAQGEGIEVLGVEDGRDLVDRVGIGAGDDGVEVNIAHEGDLALDGLWEIAVRAADNGVRLDADRSQLGDRVLGGLGLELARGAKVGHE